MKTVILFILILGFATTILSGQNQLRGGEKFVPPDGGEFIDIDDMDKLPKGVELNSKDDCYLEATRRCLSIVCEDDEGQIPAGEYMLLLQSKDFVRSGKIVVIN